MGLFLGSVTWPMWKESAGWRDVAYKGFEKEALLQNAEDGVNLEQGIWYHHEVTDMMLLCLLVGSANGYNFSPAYCRRLESMLEFIASLMDVGGNMPMIGDSDDAVMVRFIPHGINVYQSQLATGAVLFNRGDFKSKAVYFDDKSRWLLGNKAEIEFNALEEKPEKLPVRRSFKHGGYYLLGCEFGRPEEVQIAVDAGPLGYLSIAAHGHADALAFTMSVAGREILVDPGTYAYHTQKKWRDYFRGTSAHNTLRIDGIDQSVAGGNFLWLRHANARCLRFESTAGRVLWQGEHDGYLRLADPVLHRRMIDFDKPRKILKIIDNIEAKEEHFIELHWHFSEHCDLEVQDSIVVARNNGVTITMAMHGIDWQPELVLGREAPPLGWISRKFDKKEPAYTVRWAGQVEGSAKLQTEIRIQH